MKPPPVQYIESARRQSNGCGCSLGCLGIGCLLSAAAFFGLLILAYYATLHTSLPLKLIERAIEEDGKIEVDGLAGNIANGLRFDKFRFLGDGKKWSELRDVSLRYQGLVGINFSGDIDIREVRVGGGILYLDLARPEQFSLSLPGFEFDSVLDEEERAALMHAGNWNIDSVEIGNIEVVNPNSAFRFSIDHARISGLRFRRGQLVDMGMWSIASDLLDVKTEASRRWPESVTARRLVAVVREGFFANLREDFEVTLEVEGGDAALQYHGECADGKLVVDDNGRRMMVEFDNYTPSDYFQVARELPLQQITFRATRLASESAGADVRLESGGHFQLGATRFAMSDPTIDPAMRFLRGDATWQEHAVRMELTSDSVLYTRIFPQLWIDDQPATLEQWSAIIYDRPWDELTTLEQSILETAKRRAETTDEDPSTDEDALPDLEAEAEDQELPSEPGDVEEADVETPDEVQAPPTDAGDGASPAAN